MLALLLRLLIDEFVLCGILVTATTVNGIFIRDGFVQALPGDDHAALDERPEVTKVSVEEHNMPIYQRTHVVKPSPKAIALL